MKKYTNKVLAGIFAMIIVCVMLSVAAPYLFKDWLFTVKPVNHTQQSTAASSLAVNGFDSIVVNGAWKIHVRQGEYSVQVNVPGDAAHAVRVSGSELILAAVTRNANTDSEPSIDITMPKIYAITVRGAADVQIDGFKDAAHAFTLTVYGASNLKATDLSIDNLVINIQGSSNIDFVGCSIANAVINGSGASHVSLATMTGGTLSGKLDGVSAVEYLGNVTSNSIQTMGMAVVKHR